MTAPKPSQEMKHIAWKDVEREKLNPLIDREMVVGDKVMLARVLMKKGAHVPQHHHHNEQVTYILEGALKFAVAMGFEEANLLTEESRLAWLVWKRSLRDAGGHNGGGLAFG